MTEAHDLHPSDVGLAADAVLAVLLKELPVVLGAAVISRPEGTIIAMRRRGVPDVKDPMFVRGTPYIDRAGDLDAGFAWAQAWARHQRAQRCEALSFARDLIWIVQGRTRARRYVIALVTSNLAAPSLLLHHAREAAQDLDRLLA